MYWPDTLRIRAILMDVWDPVGIADVQAARDEYDTYVPALARLVAAGASADAISAALASYERDLGLPPDWTRARHVALRLHSLE